MNTTVKSTSKKTISNKCFDKSERFTKINTHANANDTTYQLVDMKYITKLTGMTNKWFYSLIKNTEFPKPIKLGRSSRWKLTDIERWIEERMSS